MKRKLHITETNLSPWLHSIQQTFRTQSLFTAIDESVLRIETTREKINSILHKLYTLEEKWGVPIGSYKERISAMIDIRDAIGVYGIYHPTHSRRERHPNMLWHAYELSPERSNRYKEGGEWLDYFGVDDGITDVGGYVTVSLSDSGILYLNSIREGVSSLYDSYTNTTVTT
jgi:hypothetical protein